MYSTAVKQKPEHDNHTPSGFFSAQASTKSIGSHFAAVAHFRSEDRMQVV